MESNPSPDKKRQSGSAGWGEWVRWIGILQVILIELITLPLAGIGIGYFAYRRLGLPRWVTMITGFAGFAVGMYRVYQIVIAEEKK